MPLNYENSLTNYALLIDLEKVKLLYFKRIKLQKNTAIIKILSTNHNDVQIDFKNMCSMCVHRCDD